MTVTSRHAYGASVLLDHVDALAAQVPGVRQAENIDRVHKMRVASRRLRAALDLFGEVLPARKLKKWTRRIKKVTRALGAARDTDVQIAFLDQFGEHLPEDRRRELRPGLDRLLLRLRQKRNNLQGGVLKAMDRLESSDVTRDMQQVLRQVIVDARTDGVDPRSVDLQHEARELIGRRREQLLVFEPYVEQPEAAEQHHEMRIAAKYLRYTLEAYADLFKGKLKPQIKIVKRVQEQLGEIHDADVWVDFVPRFIEEERHRFHEFFGHSRGMARLLPGLDFLREDRRAARRGLHQQFVQSWLRTVREDRWNELTAVLDGAVFGRTAPADAARDDPTPDADDFDERVGDD